MADRQRQQAAPTASQTTTQTAARPERRTQTPRTLRLRGASQTEERSVQWADDVVDNEGLGRKSSKVCCIYHKPKAVDESSDSSSSSSSSDSDSDSDSGAGKGNLDGDKVPACGHSRHGRGRGREEGSADKRRRRRPSPNAYEKVPKQKENKEGTAPSS